eukprot:CAMPEP_0171968920 /NCGR_PEP_ID=MMETSP0993-20121228/206000_1 /TAXON_ID=483369 /ORGANISM="non described non described, Strain CCMP2098" /LENGTH=134 /DNA_ID=CAMNT_0012618733 /DNA_START=83 /DNA_END=486 /DNA_ORIENTATION=-
MTRPNPTSFSAGFTGPPIPARGGVVAAAATASVSGRVHPRRAPTLRPTRGDGASKAALLDQAACFVQCWRRSERALNCTRRRRPRIPPPQPQLCLQAQQIVIQHPAAAAAAAICFPHSGGSGDGVAALLVLHAL